MTRTPHLIHEIWICPSEKVLGGRTFCSSEDMPEAAEPGLESRVVVTNGFNEESMMNNKIPLLEF